MIATDSGLADFFTIIAIVLLAICVLCCLATLAPEKRQVPAAARLAALFGWAGVMFGWMGTLVT